MGLREKFRKKNDSEDEAGARPSNPEFTFIRTDTHSAEVIYPPSAGPERDSDQDANQFLSVEPRSDLSSRQRRSLDIFRSSRSRSTSVSSQHSSTARRLSQRLHLSRSPSSSEHVPQDLPEIVTPEDGTEDKETTESQWEKRATILVRETEKLRSRPGSPVYGSAPPINPQLQPGEGSNNGMPGARPRAVSSKAIDDDIQEAIRLHEAGRLEESTALFGRLADPKGANNPLSQVLYGLALRYVRSFHFTRKGRNSSNVTWGCLAPTVVANAISRSAPCGR